MEPTYRKYVITSGPLPQIKSLCQLLIYLYHIKHLLDTYNGSSSQKVQILQQIFKVFFGSWSRLIGMMWKSGYNGLVRLYFRGNEVKSMALSARYGRMGSRHWDSRAAGVVIVIWVLMVVMGRRWW
jgi:hypothetical protein